MQTYTAGQLQNLPMQHPPRNSQGRNHIMPLNNRDTDGNILIGGAASGADSARLSLPQPKELLSEEVVLSFGPTAIVDGDQATGR